MTPGPCRGRRALVAVALSLLAALTALPAQAATSADVDPFTTAMTTSLTRMATSSAYLGPALSGMVVDAGDGTVVWQHNATRARMPASVQKVLTAYTVLHSMDPATSLATTTCQNASTPSRVYLRGGGDPSLSTARLQALAATTAEAVRGSGLERVSVHVDGSFFPAPTAASGWTKSYLRSEVQLVRGLTVAWYRKGDGHLAAGRVFAAALKAQGIEVSTVSAALTPKQCSQLGDTQSAPVGTMVAIMLAASNNDYAEFLLRHAAKARGYPPSWKGAQRNEVDLLKSAGVPTGGLQISDGSGLSRSDRTPVASLAAVLRLLRDDQATADIVFAPDGLPIAGETGTLKARFAKPPQDCARGHVRAKTGSLADVVTLAGVAEGLDGRDRIFVFLENGSRKYTSARTAVDALATTTVGCGLAPSAA